MYFFLQSKHRRLHSVIVFFSMLMLFACSREDKGQSSPKNALEAMFQSYQEAMFFDLGTGVIAPIGSPDAEVSLTVFIDVYCIHCQRFHADLEKILSDNPSLLDKISVDYRFFPLSPYSYPATALALHMNNINQFEEFHNRLSREEIQSEEEMFELAQSLVSTSLPSKEQLLEKYGQNVQDAENLAHTLNLEGTPSIFLNGRKLPAMGAEQLIAFIQGYFL